MCFKHGAECSCTVCFKSLVPHFFVWHGFCRCVLARCSQPYQLHHSSQGHSRALIPIAGTQTSLVETVPWVKFEAISSPSWRPLLGVPRSTPHSSTTKPAKDLPLQLFTKKMSYNAMVVSMFELAPPEGGGVSFPPMLGAHPQQAPCLQARGGSPDTHFPLNTHLLADPKLQCPSSRGCLHIHWVTANGWRWWG